MNIGFDLDGVLVNTPPFIPYFVIEKLYKRSEKEKLSYRYPGETEKIIRIFSHNHIFRLPIQHNVTFIKQLKKKNIYRHYLISSRFGFLKKKTEELVKKHQLDKTFDGLFFNFDDEQPHIFKNRIIKKLNIHKYVDDDLQLLEFIVSKNRNVLCFWLNKKHKGFLNKNLLAITKLSDMVKLFER